MYKLTGKNHQIVLSGSGTLVSLRDTKTGREYIAPDDGLRPLFRISCAEFIDGIIQPGDLHFSSRLAESVNVTETDGCLIIKYEKIDGLDMDAECAVKIDENDGLFHFSIRIENRTGLALHSVEYPVIDCVAMLGDSAEDDRILLPKQDGYLLPSPLAVPWEGDYPYRRTDQRFQYPGEGREFPANLSAQLLAYYDPMGGMYLAVYDPDGHPKMLGPVWHEMNNPDVVSFTPLFQVSPYIGNNFAPEFDTVLGCFYGDWQDAADIYKKWSSKQKWCSRSIADRDDIPSWIKQGAMFFNVRLRGQDSGEEYTKELPGYLENWSRTFGIPLVAMMCGWEKRGEWVGPDYFPPFGGDERFRDMCTEMKKHGIKPFPFGLSGFKLPIRKKIGTDWPQPELAIDYDNRREFRDRLSKYAATDSCGNYITDSPVESWDGLHAYACVSTLQAREQTYGATMKLVKDYGVQVSQMDQVFGGGVAECYNPDHDHPLGRGVWQVEELKKIYDDMRRDAKDVDKDFALSQEFQSELFLQHLDIYHARIFDEPRGIKGVPLFAYLYHEYLPCYGGDWSSQLSDNTCGIYNHAANFVYGCLPAACPQTMTRMMKNMPPEECDPGILEMGKNACSMFRRFTNYLVLGKMRKTRAINVPDIEVRFTGLNFSGWKKGIMRVPAVLHCAWEDPDGNRACAFANISDMPQKVEYQLEHNTGKARLWINNNNVKEMAVTNTAVFTLESHAVAMLEE